MTFVLTDIQDSTRLWDTHPREMRLAMIEHDRIVEHVVDQHDGVVVRPRGEGDSRFAVFSRGTDAIAAATTIQVALSEHAWNLPGELLVRIGVHTGEADIRDGDYYGSAINRCARLRSLAAGGQVLVSGATVDLIQDTPDQWPSGTSPRFVGEYQFAGLSRSERVFELVIEGLDRSLIPPPAGAASPSNNLPAQVTSFIGRRRELAALEQHILDISVRLLTLVGPGGAGKTRLALELARNVLGAFKDGVYFVSLAAVSDQALLPSAVAKALRIVGSSESPIEERVVAHLRDKHVLLVLDNFEQLVGAAVWVANLLEACPRLSILVTSRSLLHVLAEHAFDVAPLDVPPAGASSEVIERGEAVQLFVARARAANPSFTLTPDNIGDVAEICRRVDGLPLGIELVAARTRTLSAAALNRELARRRLSLLTLGPHDAPARHHTLRAALAWSYDALGPAEQQVFRELSVFPGGCAHEHLTAVHERHTGSGDIDTAVDSLLEASLVQIRPTREGDARYVMLQTVRDFAAELLERDAESEAIREAHAWTYCRLLEELAQQRGGPGEASGLRRLALEHDNLRAAAAWALARQHVDLALHMADLGWWFLLTYGFTQEGVRWLDQVLRLSADEPGPLRGRVLVGAGRLAHQLGDEQSARHYLEEALTQARSSQELELLELALGGLSFVLFAQGEVARGLQLAHENVEVARQIGEPRRIAYANVRLAEHLVVSGDPLRGAQAAELAVQLTDGLGDGSLAAALDTLGLARRLQGAVVEADKLLERAVALHREFGYTTNLAEALFRRADALLDLDQVVDAASMCAEGLHLSREAGSRARMANGLRVASAVCCARGDFREGYALAQGAQRLYVEVAREPVYRMQLEAVLAQAEAGLGVHCEPVGNHKLGQAELDELVKRALGVLAPNG